MASARARVAEHREIASEHIRSLFEQADRRFQKDKAMANRYVQLALRMAMKHKVKLPPSLKRRVCKHCHRYLMPGSNCRVRMGGQKVIYYCLDCKHFMRFPYKGRAARKAVNSLPKPIKP